MWCVIFLVILFHISYSINVDLILSLQKYFKSKLIVFVTKPSEYLISYKLLRQKGGNYYVGFVNLKKNFEVFKMNIENSRNFRNALLISNYDLKFIVNIARLSYESPELMTTLSWINFIDGNVTFNDFNSVYVPYDCKFLLIKKGLRVDEITEIYRLRSNSTLIESQFGTWDEEKKLTAPVEDFYSRRKDLNGFSFTLGVSLFEDVGGPTQNFDLWKTLQEQMNFTYTYRSSEPIGGTLNPADGFKTGIFETIGTEIDTSLGFFIVLGERLAFYDFIWPTYVGYMKFFLRFRNQFQWQSYLAPFHKYIWMTIFIWANLAFITLYVINKLIIRHYGEMINFSHLIIIRALCNQSGYIPSSHVSFYICILMPYLLVVILLQAYSGCLMSYLTVDSFTPPFQDLDELIKNTDYKILTNPASFLYQLFMADRTVKGRKIRDRLEDKTLQPTKIEDGFRSICCRDGYTFIGAVPMIIEEMPCKVMQLERPVFTISAGLMMHKPFPFKTAMTKILWRLQKSGASPWNKIPRNFVIQSDESNLVPISLKSIGPLFFLYLITITVAFFMLCVELLISKIFTKTRR